MGKRKEESISKPGSQKRLRQEYTNEHSDESNDEENSKSSADSSFSLLSVSCLKSFGEEDIRKSWYKKVLCLWLTLKCHVGLHVGFSRTNIKETTGSDWTSVWVHSYLVSLGLSSYNRWS